MHQVRLAILVELARAGGELDTTAIIDALDVPASTVLGGLKALEAAKYVSASDPPETRKGGRRVVWKLQAEAVVSDLNAIIAILTN